MLCEALQNDDTDVTARHHASQDPRGTPRLPLGGSPRKGTAAWLARSSPEEAGVPSPDPQADPVGRVTVNVVPLPGRLWTLIVPP